MVPLNREWSWPDGYFTFDDGYVRSRLCRSQKSLAGRRHLGGQSPCPVILPWSSQHQIVDIHYLHAVIVCGGHHTIQPAVDDEDIKVQSPGQGAEVVATVPASPPVTGLSRSLTSTMPTPSLPIVTT